MTTKGMPFIVTSIELPLPGCEQWSGTATEGYDRYEC